MAQTINKYRIIQKVSAEDTLLLHPETAADAVLFDKTDSNIQADNVQSAFKEIERKINSLESESVIGIKGDKEMEYRKGEVNLTAANVGAEPTGTVEAHNSNAKAHNDIRTAVSAAQAKADSAYTLAEGRSRGISFETAASMTDTLKGANKTDYRIGDNLFVKSKDVPDYWVSGILETNSGIYGYYEIAELESEKVNLDNYQTKADSTLVTTAKTIVDAIGEVKGDADKANIKANQNSIALEEFKDGTTKVAKASEADAAIKLKSARKIVVNVNSGAKSDGYTEITANGEQEFDGSADKSISVTIGDSGVAAGTYSAIQVNAKGIVVTGGQMIEIGVSGQKTPGVALATGGLFFQMI